MIGKRSGPDGSCIIQKWSLPMNLTKEELQMLVEGYPPHMVREDWDGATIIPELAKIALCWIPYPENKPEKEGFYLVTVESTDGDYVTQAYCFEGFLSLDYAVTAFCEFPLPYEREEE
jgi:hypothetical protein